jgi:hypothetical protein
VKRGLRLIEPSQHLFVDGISHATKPDANQHSADRAAMRWLYMISLDHQTEPGTGGGATLKKTVKRALL